MKELNWQRKPAYFFCPVCRKWIDDSTVTIEQLHDRLRGGCGQFVYAESDTAIWSMKDRKHG